MALSPNQINILIESISNYNYPKVTYDFQNNKEITHPTIRDVERVIKQDLTSGIENQVRDGLSNVLYWGHRSAYYYWYRVNDFRDRVNNQQIKNILLILKNMDGTNLQKIKELKLPQFSNITFISKLRMFLDPTKFVVLDRKLMKLAKAELGILFSQLKQDGNMLLNARSKLFVSNKTI